MKRIFALLVLIAALAFPQTIKGQGEQTVSYSGSTAYVLTNVPANPNLVNGTNIFLMNVNPPSNSARIYVTNTTANACANFSIAMTSTADQSVASFISNQNPWQTINLQSPGKTFLPANAFTLPSSGTIAFTSQPIIGGKIAIQLVVSSGCLTTNVSMEVVFGNFQPPIGSVQGVAAQGAAAGGIAPVLIGGVDLAGNAQSVNVVTNPSGGLQGIPIGCCGTNGSGTYANARLPGNSTDGPLIAAIYAIGTTSTETPEQMSNGSNGGACSSTGDCSGIYTADKGYFKQATATITSSGQTISLWAAPNAITAGHGDPATMTCSFAIHTNTVTGTTPTLDAFIQDGPDGTNFNDRIHFTQMSAAGVTVGAGIAGTGANEAVVTYTSRTIAAGTIVSGPLSEFGQWNFTVGGTTPSFNITVTANCK